MHHGPEFSVVVLFGLTLAIGAATRQLANWIRFPYTILMLLLGLGAGLGIEALTGGHGAEHGEHGGGGFLSMIAAGAEISPDLIIFVFLPALVFESAFAIEVHRFRKNLGAVLVMAVPALIAATVLTAALMVGLTASDWGWGWPTALVFGALISATDPVAVVAILGELGVSKRIGVLIEGESLFNDATAIVVFTLLLALLAGEVESFSVANGIMDFLRVAIGGIVVGLLLAWLLSTWIARLFNDPSAEITLTLVLAYSAMVIGEGFLHVSGVMAVVMAGLWMSGVGRTKISPEVGHFLHRFWQMLGYIANTLIFFLVGLAISKVIGTATLGDVGLILLAYLGIMAIRFALTYATQPITTRVSEGISMGDAAVMSWGGLRGAVSLALALIVSQHPGVEPVVGDQILLVSVGVVFLTILVNGTTIGSLLAWLGFDKPPLPKQLANLSAHSQVLDGVQEAIAKLSGSRDLRTVPWTEVENRLEERIGGIDQEIQLMRSELEALPDAERVAGYWQQILGIERQVYWEAFARGTLGADAVQLLSREIDLQLDGLTRGGVAPPASRTPSNPGGLLTRLRGMLRGGRMGFEQVELLYELSRAETLGAEHVLAGLDKLKGASPTVLKSLEETYQSYLRAAKERIEDFRTNLPEMASAIESRLAQRIELNAEREGFDHLLHHGVIDEGEAEAQIASVEERMHALLRSPTSIAIPKTIDLVRTAPLFRELDASALGAIAELIREQVHPKGTVLAREGERGESLLVIARGAVHVSKLIGGQDTFLDVLGGGDVIGEISLLTESDRTATITAATSVTLGELRRDAFEHLMATQPALEKQLWRSFTRRNLSDAVLGRPEFGHLEREDRLRWIDSGQEIGIPAGESKPIGEGRHWAFVLSGAVLISGRKERPFALVRAAPGTPISASEAARVVLLPDPAGV